MSTRQWSIKGNQISDPRAMQIVRAECDGPVPEVNETVHVIEKSAYDRLKAENEKLREAVRGALGWFALFNDEEDPSKWPAYVRKCEAALDKGKNESD